MFATALKVPLSGTGMTFRRESLERYPRQVVAQGLLKALQLWITIYNNIKNRYQAKHSAWYLFHFFPSWVDYIVLRIT
jgi:hypothetical protein